MEKEPLGLLSPLYYPVGPLALRGQLIVEQEAEGTYAARGLALKRLLKVFLPIWQIQYSSPYKDGLRRQWVIDCAGTRCYTPDSPNSQSNPFCVIWSLARARSWIVPN